MSLLVVGSVALDSVETPKEKREEQLGGSATHFAYASSYFAPTSLVSVVGEDWPQEHTKVLTERKIDTQGMVVVPGGKTFRWTGRYHANMNDRDTLETHLNVFGDFDPVIPLDQQKSKFLFLANGSPVLHMKTLDQMQGETFSVADTMNLWIDTQHDELLELLKRVDGLVLNDDEAQMLARTENMVEAGQRILELGPSFVVLKKGEHGAFYFSREATYVLPAFPTLNVLDPTGAGDSFAGGMMGYLAESSSFDPATMRKALAYGTVVASFNVEGFGLDRMRGISREDIDTRLEIFRGMLSF